MKIRVQISLLLLMLGCSIVIIYDNGLDKGNFIAVLGYGFSLALFFATVGKNV